MYDRRDFGIPEKKKCGKKITVRFKCRNKEKNN